MATINYKRVDDGKGWKNKVTPLNATNMNHMDTGILNACDGVDKLTENYNELNEIVNGENSGLVKKVNAAESNISALRVDVDGHSTKFAGYDEEIEAINEELAATKETAEAAKESAETANTGLLEKQDILRSGVDIKTINNQSILGGGDLHIEAGDKPEPYEEMISADINQMTDKGLYKIENAINAPVGTANKGLLKVVELDNGSVEQEWMAQDNNAVRVLGGSSKSYHFSVNGKEVPQGEVVLPICGNYELQGDLIGHIRIGNGTEELVNNRTKIILKGVNILSDLVEDPYCIGYLPKDGGEKTGKLVVELAEESENYLVVPVDTEKADNDKGALHSNNNLVINGVGFLSIRNKKGHGIKAGDLCIDGDPHIYVDAKHDAVHGGKLLKITGGYFEIDNANDAFSSSDGPLNDGIMSIFGGEFVINKCAQSAFQGKSENGVKQILGAKITLGENIGELFTSPNGFKIYEGLNTIINNSGKELPEYTSLASMYGEPIILDDNMDPVDCGPDIIELNPTADKDYKLSGNFSGHKILLNPAAGVKIGLNIKNLYYVDDSDDAEPFIDQRSVTKRVKLKFDTENSLSYISKKNGCAIKTGKNVQITSKGDVIISCENGYAIDARDGYCLLSGDGLRKISNSKYGIYATSIRLGEDPEDIDEAKYSNSDDPIYIIGNTEKDIVISNWNDADVSVKYTKQIIETQYHSGIAVLGNIAQDEGLLTAEIKSQSGEVKQKEGSAFYNSALCYVKNAYGVVQDGTKDLVEISGVKKEFPALNPEETSDWTVYKGVDAYTKEESDAKYVSKEDADLFVTKAEVAELLDKQQKVLKKLQKTEDRLAPQLYSSYPTLTFGADPGFDPVIVRGNKGVVGNAIWTTNNKTYSYHKNGQGYEADKDDAQFNIIINGVVENETPVDFKIEETYEGGKPYTNCKTEPYLEDGIEIPGKVRISYTKVTGNLQINIKVLDQEIEEENIVH